MACCQDWLDRHKATIRYDLMVVSGWYDGAINGAFRCAKCSRTFAFDMAAEDFELEIRVFAIAPLPGEAFERLFQAPCLAGKRPRFRHDLAKATEQEKLVIATVWDELDRQRGEPTWIASGRAIDEPLWWRAITPELAARLPPLEKPDHSLDAWQDCLRS
ncbi:MAG: hypothetical protein U0836_00220 [Pirellulales bacterium]